MCVCVADYFCDVVVWFWNDVPCGTLHTGYCDGVLVLAMPHHTLLPDLIPGTPNTVPQTASSLMPHAQPLRLDIAQASAHPQYTLRIV